MRKRWPIGTGRSSWCGCKWRKAVATVPVFAIVVLSLLPGGWQERTGLPGPLEHVIAYFGTGMLMSFVWPGVRRGLRNVVMLVTLSAAMELLQNLSPGRDPRLTDVMWGSLGAICGVIFARWIAVMLGRKYADKD